MTQKILTLLGDGDKAEEMVQSMSADEIERLGNDDEVEENTDSARQR